MLLRIKKFWMRHFMVLEGMIVLGVVSVFATWLYAYDGTEFLDSNFSDNRFSVFAVLATLFGTLLGFTIAAITFLFGISDKPAFRILRASRAYPDHWGIFRSVLRACSLATLTSLVGVLSAGYKDFPTILLVAIFGSVVWAIARLYRVVWVICEMIDAEVRMGKDTRDQLLNS